MFHQAHLPLFLALLALGTLLVGKAGGEELRRVANTDHPGLPFSAAVELGDFLYLSGALGLPPGSRTLPEGAKAQTKQTLDNLEKALQGQELDLSRVVEARVYVSDARLFDEVAAEVRSRFGKSAPALTMVEAALALPGAEVEITIIAAKKGVPVEPLQPKGWKESQAVRAGNTLFLAAQQGVDPKTGQVVASETAKQAKQAFGNLQELLEAGGLALSNVTNCRAFLADARDFQIFNESWKEAFPSDPPVRETLQARLEKGLKVSLHCQAVAGERKIVQPGSGTPFSTAIAAGGRLYTSGMVARGPQGWPSGAAEQTKTILEKLRAALEAAGLGPSDVADATVVLSDPRYFEAMNEEYQKFFPEGFPTRVTTAMPLMAPEALVEISFIAQHRTTAPKSP